MPNKNRKQEGDLSVGRSRLSLTLLSAHATLQIVRALEELQRGGGMDHATSAPKLGFAIRFQLTDGLGEDGALELWDDFIAGPVEGRGLSCDPDGGNTNGLARLLYRLDTSATEDDRRAVREWARRRGEIADYDVGPLTNCIATQLMKPHPSDNATDELRT